LKLPPLAIPWALEILKERLRAFKDGSIDENSQVIKQAEGLRHRNDCKGLFAQESFIRHQ